MLEESTLQIFKNIRRRRNELTATVYKAADELENKFND